MAWYVRDGKCIQNFSRTPEEKRPLGRLGVNGRVILKKILRKQEIGYEDVNLIHLAQGIVQLQALVNTVMNVRFL
jgi:hypothetical protein